MHFRSGAPRRARFAGTRTQLPILPRDASQIGAFGLALTFLKTPLPTHALLYFQVAG